MRWTALVMLAACAGEEVEGYGPATCDGGGEPIVEIGDGGQLDFAPFTDNDTVDLRSDGSIEVQLFTSGLDTSNTVTVSIRTSIGGGTTRDSLSSFNLVCNDDIGHGWLGAYPGLPDGVQAGDVVDVVATVTDASGGSASGEVALTVR